MYMKCFTPKMLYTKDNAGCDGEPFGIASAVVSIQTLMKTGGFSRSERYFSKKPSSGPRKRYELPLCIAVCPSQLFAEAEIGWKFC